MIQDTLDFHKGPLQLFPKIHPGGTVFVFYHRNTLSSIYSRLVIFKGLAIKILQRHVNLFRNNYSL